MTTIEKQASLLCSFMVPASVPGLISFSDGQKCGIVNKIKCFLRQISVVGVLSQRQNTSQDITLCNKSPHSKQLIPSLPPVHPCPASLATAGVTCISIQEQIFLQTSLLPLQLSSTSSHALDHCGHLKPHLLILNQCFCCKTVLLHLSLV